ncbi:MAG: hypothetical protein HY863_06670 [Chloroflexi bacterium]|nr:hypothetical protein [Chloroflexota bacterium]
MPYLVSSSKFIGSVRVSDNPFNVDDDFIVRPPHISPRIAAQSACFTVSKKPIVPFESGGSYNKILIQVSKKKSILKELNRYGINPANLFPGLDGISKKLAFELSSIKELTLNMTKDITGI